MGSVEDNRLPTVTEDGSEASIILHVDMDCFYAACEQLRNPALDGNPVIVGMGYDEENPTGAVATASYEAREYGIESAMAIREALDRLPRNVEHENDPDTDTGYYRPVDMEYYKSVSRDVKQILREYAEVFEPVSIDEAYLDVSNQTTWANARDYGAEVKHRIATDVGVTASVGIAPTKSAAKIASDHDKPDGLVIVNPGEVRSFFDPLDVESVHGIGPVTADTLHEMDIHTAGDLAEADPLELESVFGSRGREFYDRAHGRDPRAVTPPNDPKSLSKESSVNPPLTDHAAKQEKIRTLAHRVATRAEKKSALYQTVGIKVVVPPFDIHTREQSLPGPVQDESLVESIALELLDEFVDETVRKLGVRLSGLSFSSRQQSGLNDWESTDQLQRADGTDRFADLAKRDQRTINDFLN